ncbi:MAG TPA: metallophosphoesterase [Chloroflexia bacterium]|nr:metallophosphoesterase [Chloroflexia bacterium]
MRVKLAGGLVLGLVLAGCSGAAPPAAAPALPPVAQIWPTQLPTPTGAPPAGSAADTAAGDLAAPPAARAGPRGGGPDWTFAVVGDTWKDTPMLRYILHDAVAHHDSLLVDLGDLTPQGRPEQLAEFARLARGAGLPVYAVPGNHDVAWSQNTQPFEQFWPRHQSFDYRNAHFTIADDSAVTFSRAELAWVAADLAATAQPLKFVFVHVPPLMPYPVPAESALQAGGPEFSALMEQYQVTTVFAGHLHAYTRLERNGVPYVITGGGGEPLHVPALLGGRYHYVRVAVQGTTTQETMIALDTVPTPTP